MVAQGRTARTPPSETSLDDAPGFRGHLSWDARRRTGTLQTRFSEFLSDFRLLQSSGCLFSFFFLFSLVPSGLVPGLFRGSFPLAPVFSGLQRWAHECNFSLASKFGVVTPGQQFTRKACGQQAPIQEPALLPCRIDSLLLLHLGLPVAWFGTSGMYWVLFFVNILTAFVLFSSGAFHWLRWLGDHKYNSQSTISADQHSDWQKVNEHVVDLAPVTFFKTFELSKKSVSAVRAPCAEFCPRRSANDFRTCCITLFSLSPSCTHAYKSNSVV